MFQLVLPIRAAAFGLAFALLAGAAAPGETAKAEANRKKPLQRCDQLNDKAEIDCLKKARERIVEARRAREGSGGKDAPAPAAKAEPKDTRAGK